MKLMRTLISEIFFSKFKFKKYRLLISKWHMNLIPTNTYLLTHEQAAGRVSISVYFYHFFQLSLQFTMVVYKKIYSSSGMSEILDFQHCNAHVSFGENRELGTNQSLVYNRIYQICKGVKQAIQLTCMRGVSMS